MDTVCYRFERAIPLVAECDVLVVGGGPGGIGAGVMAARFGAKTVLAERYAAPGGMAFFGEVTPFMPNHFKNGPDLENDWETMDRPVYVEWCEKMWNYWPDGTKKHFKQTEFNPKLPHTQRIAKDVSALAAEELLLESGVKLLYHHNLVDVMMNGRKIDCAVFATKSGYVAVRAKTFVDATGDGDLAVLAGCRSEFGNEDGFCQPMTLCFKLGNVNIAKIPPLQELNKLYDKAREAGEIHCLRENILYFDTLDNTSIHFNTTRIVKKSGVDSRELSEAEIEGRRQMREFFRFFRTRVPGFEEATILSMGHHIGIRETRRITGRLKQTADDFSAARKYPDAIARNRYTIDIHNPSGTGTVIKSLPFEKFYEISYRAILPADCDNVVIGCRAISVDHALHSSTRVMPPVVSVGQAAGLACAMACRDGVLPCDLDGVRVREELKKRGAFL